MGLSWGASVYITAITGVKCSKKELKNEYQTQNRLKQSMKNNWPNLCELAEIWHLCLARGPRKKIFISKHTSFFDFVISFDKRI